MFSQFKKNKKAIRFKNIYVILNDCHIIGFKKYVYTINLLKWNVDKKNLDAIINYQTKYFIFLNFDLKKLYHLYYT